MRLKPGIEGAADALLSAVEDAGFEAKLIDKGGGQDTLVLKVQCLSERKQTRHKAIWCLFKQNSAKRRGQSMLVLQVRYPQHICQCVFVFTSIHMCVHTGTVQKCT